MNSLSSVLAPTLAEEKVTEKYGDSTQLYLAPISERGNE